MGKTSINLDERSRAFVDRKVEDGRYASTSEVVREALRRMEADDEHSRAELAMLDEAEASGLDARSHEQLWDELEAGLRRTPAK